MKYFSKSTGGFYTEEDHGAKLIERVTTDPETGETLDRWIEPNPDCRIPADAVEVPDDEHAALLAAEKVGKVIQGDANGRPFASDPVATEEGVRAMRNRLLAESDWTQIPDVPVETRAKWQPYRQLLRDVPQQAGFPGAVEWPEAPLQT